MTEDTEIWFEEMPDANTIIRLTDDLSWHGYRTHPFGWLQTKCIAFFFGWKVENS